MFLAKFYIRLILSFADVWRLQLFFHRPTNCNFIVGLLYVGLSDLIEFLYDICTILTENLSRSSTYALKIALLYWWCVHIHSREGSTVPVINTGTVSSKMALFQPKITKAAQGREHILYLQNNHRLHESASPVLTATHHSYGKFCDRLKVIQSVV